MAMTNEQKRRLAQAFIHYAANLTEAGMDDELLADVPVTEQLQQISNWLGKLPGNAWDVRLPQPE